MPELAKGCFVLHMDSTLMPALSPFMLSVSIVCATLSFFFMLLLFLAMLHGPGGRVGRPGPHALPLSILC